jgi:hypothetical protein
MFASSLFKSSTPLLLASLALALSGCSSRSSSVVHAAGPSGVKNVYSSMEHGQVTRDPRLAAGVLHSSLR